ncbi:GNAT family N-acetyltransferase [Steroidobacter sp. S1-65]|uniref:GNAT family N-acetyltransferase n=1 Tax=Steroidobacter gossypii TaxID=2805490 RepID=A0ABS1WWW1_9GAMM|nr:N-acetyltransferase [Steroidobacter gossypii]MBM0105465.1 GNAT family N-acetyltransferase [Steroidobacter gossypii]
MSSTADIATIRRATVDDAAVLAELGATTFTETFGHLYPPEDLQDFLGKSHSTDSWRRSLSDPNKAVWLAVHPSSRHIGFIVVGACKLPVEQLEPTAGEVQQLYVLAEFHNLRLGARLMAAGFEWLESQGRTPLYIGVWSENYGAQRFYQRYGFSKVGEYGFPVGKTVDREFILKR